MAVVMEKVNQQKRSHLESCNIWLFKEFFQQKIGATNCLNVRKRGVESLFG